MRKYAGSRISMVFVPFMADRLRALDDEGPYQSPSSRHHTAPMPTQMAMLTTLMMRPIRHQVPSGTWRSWTGPSD